MKILKMFFALALLLGAAPVLADPPAQVGRLNYVAGAVSFAPAGANDAWSAATLNWPVTTGDRLWTDAGGRAELHVGSTAIRMPQLTSLDVLSLDERGVQLRLAQGSVNVRLRTLDAGENFEISTPNGAVVITQPGSYRVIVDDSGATTTVVVRSGQADVLTEGGTFTVLDNKLAAVSARGPQITNAPAIDEFDNWSIVRDRREDNVAATQYVPREMTGYEDLDQHGSWSHEAQYGAVWSPTTVAAGWAPYSRGRWAWVSPWGWTWVDDAPWGFAPSHYGRWVRLHNRWAWAPGARVARPVYAPALVAFVGGANWSVSIGGGPVVGWVPLGWREPYIPWYRNSPGYLRHINVTHVTNVNVINHYHNARNRNNIRYAHRGIPSATTVVTRDAFIAGRRVDRTRLRVSPQALANARIIHDAPVTRPARASLMASRRGPRLPDAVAAREVVAAKAPPTPALRDRGEAHTQFTAGDGRARVRVIGSQQRADVATQQPATQTRAAPERPQSEQQRQQQMQQQQPQPAARAQQQPSAQAEQQARQQARREQRQRQQQTQQNEQQPQPAVRQPRSQAEQQLRQTERQRLLQEQRVQREQRRQQVAQERRERLLQQQRAQQALLQERQAARQNQLQQQRTQVERRQQHAQRQALQTAERAADNRPRPKRQMQEQP